MVGVEFDEVLLPRINNSEGLKNAVRCEGKIKTNEVASPLRLVKTVKR